MNQIIRQQLLTFIAAYQRKSFTKAVEVMCISPTGIMKQIDTLEKGLNLTLFIRNNSTFGVI